MAFKLFYKKVYKLKLNFIIMKLGRKITGGKYIKRRKKKLYEKRGQRRIVKLGEDKRKTVKTRGGNIKTFLLRGKMINVRLSQAQSDSSKSQTKQKDKNKSTEIKNVLETPSNRFLARQNVLTKGTIVETDLGKVKITNRPTQEGLINGVLIE